MDHPLMAGEFLASMATIQSDVLRRIRRIQRDPWRGLLLAMNLEESSTRIFNRRNSFALAVRKSSQGML
jgi:hypothetical protein